MNVFSRQMLFCFVTACGALLAAPAIADTVTYAISCGTSTSSCTLNDFVKITASATVATDLKNAWSGTTTTVSDRDAPGRALTLPLDGTTTNPEQLVSLRPLISDRSDVALAMLFRKPSPQVSLQVNVVHDGRKVTQPFVLDLTPAYKDGTLGLILNRQNPWCYAPGAPSAAKTACAIGAILTLPVDNLAQWSTATSHEAQNLILYLNEVPMVGVPALLGSRGGSFEEPQLVSFRLVRDLATADHAKAWRTLLETSVDSQVKVNVGIGADSLRWTYPASTDLNLPRKGWVRIGIGALALVILLVLWFCTPTLRAFSGVPNARVEYAKKDKAAKDGLAALPGEKVKTQTFRGPYSLSTLLMAAWLLIVSFSFFAMWGLTFSGDLINSTALALLGFGAGALVFARAIDAPTDTDRSLDDALALAVRNFDPANAAATGPPVVSAVKAARSGGLITSNFALRDLLSEKGAARMDLHRLQLLMFSVFYMGVFLWSLNRILALPEFSSTTLGLLGISNASYLGYKFASTATT